MQRRLARKQSIDSLPEWSKGVDSSSTSASCVGSNPTAVICTNEYTGWARLLVCFPKSSCRKRTHLSCHSEYAQRYTAESSVHLILERNTLVEAPTLLFSKMSIVQFWLARSLFQQASKCLERAQIRLKLLSGNTFPLKKKNDDPAPSRGTTAS